MNAKLQSGMKIYETYLKDIEQNGQSEIVFADAIRQLGLSLSEFFYQRSLYLMRESLNKQLYTTTPDKIMEDSRDFIANQHYAVLEANVEQNIVHLGKGKDTNIDLDFCRSHNIEVCPYDSYGGAIVSGKGDYNLTLVLPNDIDIDVAVVLGAIGDIFLRYFDTVEIQGNDIMVNGKKVLGSTAANINDVLFLGFAISFTEQPEIVEGVCGQPKTGKSIGSIDAHILSREQFRKELLSWLLKP